MAHVDTDLLSTRALAWIAAHLDRFRMGEQTGIHDRLLAVRRLGDLALAATALPPEIGRPWLELCWRELDRGNQIMDLLANAPAIACIYVPFRRAGLRSRALELHLADPAWRVGWEKWQAFTQYAVGVALEAIGVPPPWSQAWLLHSMNVLALPGETDGALRAELMAHVIQWGTEMGCQPHTVGDSERAQLTRAVDAWCEKLVRGGELDALGAVLVTALCARCPVPAFAWSALAAAQRDDGSVPDRLSSLGDDDFAGLYHATLFTAIAGELVTPRTPLSSLVTLELHANYCD